MGHKPEIAWAELAGREFITACKGTGNRLVLDLAPANLPARLKLCYEVSRISTLPGLVEAGLGLAAVPRLLMPDSDHPTLACVPLVAPTVMRTLGLIGKRGRPLSHPAQQLYGLIAQTQRHLKAA